MARGKYLNDEEKRLIIRLYEIGKSEKELAAAFHRSDASIHRVIAGKDTLGQDIKAKKEKQKSPLTKKQEQRVCELAQSGKSDKAIACELRITLAAVSEFMNMPRKETKSYTSPKNDISLIPCPFTSCSNRAACKEIEEPQQCPVWKLYQNVNLEKKWGKQTIRKAIEKPQN